MQEKAGQFRSTPFGGFHRQDVLDYIEQLTQEHQEIVLLIFSTYFLQFPVFLRSSDTPGIPVIHCSTELGHVQEC